MAAAADVQGCCTRNKGRKTSQGGRRSIYNFSTMKRFQFVSVPQLPSPPLSTIIFLLILAQKVTYIRPIIAAYALIIT